MSPLAAAQFDVAPALASALLHSLWQNALLGLAAALALRAAGRAGAAFRHNLGMAFLLAMALVPAAQFLLFWGQPEAVVDAGLWPALSAPRSEATAGGFVQTSSPAAPILIGLWLLGVALMLVRHAAALRALIALERGPHQPLTPVWRKRLDEMRTALGIRRAVAVRLSDEVLMPFAARLVRPAIWLPLSLLTRAPADQIEALLAHELAHVARRDWLWNGVQCVVEALLFFHPAAWWLGRRIRQEREHACDDLAVAACGDPIALAEALTALECQRHASPRLILAATGGSLMHRVTRLLAAPPSRGRWGALFLLGALGVSGALLAAQIGLAGGSFPDLEVRASTAGALGPGDWREIRARGVDKQRFYRESVDAQGRRTQSYQEDGEARPIDAGVARWVAAVTRMSDAPLPPSHLQEDVVGTRLVALIAGRPEVVARVGSPARPTPRPIEGFVRHDGSDGSADLRIEMTGPKGKAVVAVRAGLEDRAWHVESLAIR